MSLINRCTIQTKRGGAVINAALSGRVQIAPAAEQITMAGGLVKYYVKVDPLPPTQLRENDLIFITACPTNTQLVALSAPGWKVEDRRDRAGFFPATICDAIAKVQT